MEIKQPQALSAGYRRAVGKLQKIKQLGITRDMPTAEQDTLVETLARAKGELEGKDWKKYITGQRWYVEELVRFAAMDNSQRLEHEYSLSFPDVASESEMLTSLDAISAGI